MADDKLSVSGEMGLWFAIKQAVKEQFIVLVSVLIFILAVFVIKEVIMCDEFLFYLFAKCRIVTSRNTPNR